MIWNYIKTSFITQVILLTVLIYTSLGFLVYCVYSYTNNESGRLSDYEHVGFIMKEKDDCMVLKDTIHNNEYKIHDCVYSSESFSRLYSQLKIVRERYLNHNETMVFFIQQMYLFNTLQGFMIMITTVIGLYVTKNGWEKAPKLMLIALFIFGGCLAFVEIIPITLNVEHNIENNKRKCKVYRNLETDILTYITINEDNEGNPQDMNEFIHQIDDKLKHEYTIAFDINGIPESYNFDYQSK